MKTTRSHLLAPALFAAVVAISFAAVFFRKAQPTHPLVAAGIRLAIAAVLLSPFAVRSALKRRPGGRLLRRAVLAGLLYGVHFGAWVASLNMTSIAASVTLVTTTPLILAVLGAVTGKDRPDKRLWLSLFMAATGLIIIGGGAYGTQSGSLSGDGLALLGALAMALYMLVGRSLGEEMQLLVFSAIATAVGAVALLGSAAILGIPLKAASPEAFGYIALAAILPQLVGHSLLTWSLRYTRPSSVAMAVVGEPVGAAILGWIWIGERVEMPVMFGCAITLSAVILAIARRGK